MHNDVWISPEKAARDEDRYDRFAAAALTGFLLNEPRAMDITLERLKQIVRASRNAAELMFDDMNGEMKIKGLDE